MHNLRALIRLVQDARNAIIAGTFERRLGAWLEHWQGNAARTAA